jgi:16S rRNA (cytidine1402-2'-O)-methyltransferase
VSKGKLYLVPAPLDFGCEAEVPLQDVLPLGTLRIAAGITHWICENAKSARAYLKRVDAVAPLSAPLQAQQIQELPREVHKKGDHAGQFDARPLLAAALEGKDIGLLSEAGMPAVADPGSSVARAAHELGITVVPLTGPVSLLLALDSTARTSLSSATCRRTPTHARNASASSRRSHCAPARRSFSSKRPTAMPSCCRRSCRPCSTTRDSRWRADSRSRPRTCAARR